MEEDHFELIRETFERTTEASLSEVWSGAQQRLLITRLTNANKNLGLCTQKVVTFRTFIVTLDTASPLLTFSRKMAKHFMTAVSC